MGKAKINLGKVSLTPKGVYAPETAYEYLDVLSYNGSSYVALQAFTNVIPSGDGINTMLLSAKGDKITLADLTPAEITTLQAPAITAAGIANTATTNANAATQKALDAAKAAEGIVSTVRPDYNVSDKTLSTFIANKPEIPTITNPPSGTLLTYTNSAGNVIKFKVGDKVIQQKSNGIKVYHTAIAVTDTTIEWVQDWGANTISINNPESIEANKAYIFYAEKDNQATGKLLETADPVDLLESLYMYGIEKDSEIASTACTRIGNMDLHKSLPLQSKMKRCVIKPVKDKVDPVVYYLHEDDGRFKAGTPIVTPDFVINPNLADGITVVKDAYPSSPYTTLITVPNSVFAATNANRLAVGSLEGYSVGETVELQCAAILDDPCTAPFSLSLEYCRLDVPGYTTIASNANTTVGRRTIALNAAFVVTADMLAEEMHICISPNIGDNVNKGLQLEIYRTGGELSKLDGTDGDVMVELPEFYIKFEEEGTKQRVKISERFIPGYEYIPKAYIGAFLGAVRNAAITGSGVSEMCSVINNSSSYRGGNSSAAQATWDSEPYSLLGKPYAKRMSDLTWHCGNKNQNGITGWSSMSVRSWMTLHWFCIIEYANFDYTADINNQKTAEGYAQGGIGAGLTGILGGQLSTFFPDAGWWAMAKIGHTEMLGNKTGEITLDVPKAGLTANNKYVVNSYRGIENMFSRVHVSSTWQVALNNTTTYIDCMYDRNLYSSRKTYIIPQWSTWNKMQDLSRDYGMFQKQSINNANYTNTHTNKQAWSQAHTPTAVRCGVAQSVAKRWGNIANIDLGTQYDAAEDTQTNARINYTLPR